MDAATISHLLRRSRFASLHPDYLALHERRFLDTAGLLLEAAPPPAGGGGRLLDLGIFPGFLALVAREAGYAVWGIGDETMTPDFRAASGEAGFTLAAADLERDRFPYPDGFFDTVLFTEAIEHLYRDPFHPLDESFRVLRPGGVLLVTTPNLARWDVIAGLLGGRSYRADIGGPLDESFPRNPCYGHVREYTMGELAHMTCDQDKRLYRFHPVAKRYSACWDPTPRALLRALGRPASVPGLLHRTLVPLLAPRFRSGLMIAVRKPAPSRLVPPEEYLDPEGFHPVEVDGDTGSPDRRPLPTPFRWTDGNGAFSVRPGEGFSGPLRLRLLVANLAPGDESPAAVRFLIDGREAGAVSLPPGKAYRCVDLPVPPERGDRFRLEIVSGTWRPAARGIPDDRVLGVQVSWGPLLVYRPAS